MTGKMSAEQFALSTLCKIISSTGEEINLVKFEDGDFLNLSCKSMSVNAQLNKGHSLRCTTIPFGPIRILLVDENIKDEDGDPMTYCWFDLKNEAQLDKMKAHPTIGEILQIV